MVAQKSTANRVEGNNALTKCFAAVRNRKKEVSLFRYKYLFVLEADMKGERNLKNEFNSLEEERKKSVSQKRTTIEKRTQE